MNKRQAKKRYKKIYGHNPEKEAPAKYSLEQETLEILETCEINPGDMEHTVDAIRKAVVGAASVLQNVAENIATTCANFRKKYEKSENETEAPPVVVAKKLSERRKKCRRRGGRASGR